MRQGVVKRTTLVPYTWIAGDLLLQHGSKKEYFCVCWHTKRICKIINEKQGIIAFLTIAAVNNIYINEKKKWCEEERRCLDFDCPLNKTTIASFALSEGVTVQRVRKAVPKFGSTMGVNINKVTGKLVDLSDWIKGSEGAIVTKKRKKTSLRSKEVKNEPIRKAEQISGAVSDDNAETASAGDSLSRE